MGETKKIGLIILIVNLLVLAGIGYYAFSGKNKKSAFIINQQVFNEFLGKKELEIKLSAVKVSHKKSLDSLSVLIQQSGNNVIGLKIYQENIENVRLMEQQMSDQYTADIWKQINQFVNEYGKQNGYDFILGAAGNGSLMFANETNNITEEVIFFINNRYQGD